MDKTDRELLELAAKAYWADEIDDVVSIEWSEQDEAILYAHADNQDHNGQDREYCWNPLTDDGDAFRLFVKLNLTVICGDGSSSAVQNPHVSTLKIVPHGDDPCADTRLAITRAAAAVATEALAHHALMERYFGRVNTQDQAQEGVKK